MKRQEKLTVRELMCIIEEEIEEPRQEGGNLRHKLVDILVIVLVGIICGCEQWIEIEDFAHEKEAWLREFLELPNGIPSDDTYRRVMERIKPKQLEAAYRRWVLPYIGSCIGKHIAVDGKTVCGVNKGARENKLHIVSAWVREDGITLGQVRTREKSNEITAIPELLDALDIRGATVTIDAMGCQTEIAKKIVAAQANYVLAVKQNQPSLYEAIAAYFTWAKNDPTEKQTLLQFSSYDGEHGRHVHWTVEVTHDTNWYESQKEWKQLSSMIHVTRKREQHGNTSIEHAYYISSARYDAKHFAELIRGHWSIENNLHWQLDTQFGEDASQIHKGHSPENLAVLRKISKLLLQTEPSFKASIHRKQRKALMVHDYLLSVLATAHLFE